MEYAACNVVYVDASAQKDRLVRRDDATISTDPLDRGPDEVDGHMPSSRGTSPAEHNLRTLLETFSEIHVCTSGRSCMNKLSELNQASIVELIPTIVLIDIPSEDQLVDNLPREVRTPSPSSRAPLDGVLEDLATDADGTKLLRFIATEIQYHSLSRLVVPVAVVAMPEDDTTSQSSRRRHDSYSEAHLNASIFTGARKPAGIMMPLQQMRTIRYLDTGAVDVLTSPLRLERLPSLGVHAYRAHKDALKEQRALLEMKRGRKRSWVGVDDQKPYAYLREAMVSGLMDGICQLGGDDEPIGKIRINLDSERREKVAAAVGTWHFSAHDYTDDELLHAACLMLQHALAMPELEQWRISTENLTSFMVACRSAYNAFVPYHNFRHVVDVLQACFHFLVRLGRLPPYPPTNDRVKAPPSPIAELIKPFDALTLLITAIGHDVGHPGVNNAFLVALNAPLAQLYNDRSVLESFHCAAYSQILRRHWPAAFQATDMRQLMISSILATDMGLHFDYMKKLGWLQEKLHENGGTDGWNGRLLDEQKTLACSLLIKCADISNVARKYDVASQWTMILTDEFARQASMEEDLGIPSALFAPPVREIVELGKSQLGFMNMFAIPLFQGVTDVMPGMAFCVDELQTNKLVWEGKIAEEQRARQDNEDGLRDGMFSPRSMSLASPSDGNYKTSNSGPDLRKLVLRSTTNGIAEEEPETFHHTSLPELSSDSVEASLETSTEASLSRAPKPAQLQLPLSTASAPEMRNGGDVDVTPSLVTDPVVADPQPPSSAPEKGRSSDGTEGSNATDWNSQATSATTSKMPLSPSTQATSIASDEESGTTPTGNDYQVDSASPSSTGAKSNNSETNSDTGASEKDPSKGKGITKTLRKKSSRFRMSFWKRKEKEPIPPPPTMPHDVSINGEDQDVSFTKQS